MRYLRSALLCLVLLVCLVPIAGAAKTTDGDIVGFADTVVPAGTTMKNVVVLGGNATIAGVVTDEVIVFNGNVKLLSTAYVRDRVTVLGGNYSIEDGAYVGKGVFCVGGDFAMAGTMIGAVLLFLLVWFANIAITAGLIVIPVALAWGLKGKVRKMSEIIRERTWRVFFIGLLGGLAVSIAAVILAITIIGIPVAIVLVLLAGAAGIYGLSGVCCELGRKIPLNIADNERETFFYTLYGAVLLALVFNVPLLGLVVLKLALITGFGAVISKVTRKKNTPEDIDDPSCRT